MRLKIITTLLSILISLVAIGQAKKPTLMVLPSDNWCLENDYMINVSNQGYNYPVPDYQKALLNNSDLLLVIGKINTLMSDRGFPLKDLESGLRSINQQSAEMNMMQSKTSSSALMENPIDILKRTAKADIIIQISWNLNRSGPYNSLTFNMRGLDAYTNKQIAGAQGTGEPSYSAEIPVLLEEAVLSHIDNFNSQLQSHFDDLFENGREVVIRIKVWDNAMIDLEEEYNYKGNYLELGEIIDDWMYRNTVKGRYSFMDGTETFMDFDQVRIPLYDKSERPMDTRRFLRELRSFLRNAPFNLDSKLYTRGLGEAWLIIGEK